MLCENQEIRQFLNNFPTHHWRKAIEKVSILGIEYFKLQNLPFTLKSIEDLISPNKDLTNTLDHLKQEIKQITSSIKRLERKTLSSSDISKDLKTNLKTINTKPEQFEYKPRNFSCKSEKKVNFNENRSNTPGFLMNKEVKEPQICPLKDAQCLIKYLNTSKFLSNNSRNDSVQGVSYFNTNRKRK